MKKKAKRVDGVGAVITTHEYRGETLHTKVKARSDRHAHRLAKILGWSSYYQGPGRAYAYVFYDPVSKNLCRNWGMDI